MTVQDYALDLGLLGVLYEALCSRDGDPESYSGAASGIASHIDRVVEDMNKAIGRIMASQQVPQA